MIRDTDLGDYVAVIDAMDQMDDGSGLYAGYRHAIVNFVRKSQFSRSAH